MDAFKVVVIAGVLLLGVGAQTEDDGSAFEVEWTEKDVENCPKLKERDTSACEQLKAGDKISIPSLDDCAAWAGKGRKDDYDYKGYCSSFRGECWRLYQSQKSEEEAPEWSSATCAEAYVRIWKDYGSEGGETESEE